MTRLDHADPAVSGADDAEGAQRELRAALVECGAMSVHLCAVGDVSPAALRAVAASIRSLGSGE